MHSSTDWAKKDSGWGMIDTHGNPLTDFIYSPVIYSNSPLKEPYINSIPLNKWTHNSIDYRYYYKVKRNKKYGLIDGNGKIIVDCLYDEIQSFSPRSITIYNKDKTKSEISGLARYRKGNYRGYIDKNGKEFWQDWKDSNDIK
jgi:hypothetical protein